MDLKRYTFLPTTISSPYRLLLGLLVLLCGNQHVSAQCTVEAFATPIDVYCGDPVELSAIGEGEVIFEEDFNDYDLSEWEVDPTGSFETNICGSTSPDNSVYLWFGSTADAPRDAITPCLNTTTGGLICFKMRYSANEGGDDCENPDAADEGVFLQYRINDDNCNPITGWTEIDYWDPNGGTDPYRTAWNEYCVNIPPGASTKNVQIRWAQLNNTNDLTGRPLDHWGIEDVKITVNPPNVEYTWEHTGQPEPTGSTPDVFPTEKTTYQVTYNDGVNTCTDEVTVNVIKPEVTATADRFEICEGESVTLTGTTDQTPELPTNCALQPVCDPAVDLLDEVTLGTGRQLETGGNNTGNPFGTSNCDGTMRAQILYRASELQAQGFEGGKINSISFEIGQVSQGGVYRNFSMRIACTNVNQLNDWPDPFQTNVNNEVIANTTINMGAGWNTLDFEEGYDWDGQSNIVIDFCWNLGGQGGGNRLYPYLTNVGYRATTTDCSNSAAGNRNSCGEPDVGNTRNHALRPNTRFGYCTPKPRGIETVWTPDDGTFNPSTTAAEPTVQPTTTTKYVYNARFEGGPDACFARDTVEVVVIGNGTFNLDYTQPWCEGEDLQLFSNVDNVTSYSWTGPNGFTSTEANPVIPNATAAAAGEYTLNITTSNCDGSGSITVELEPEVSAGTPSDVTICASSNSYNLFQTLSGNDNGGTWLDNDNSGFLEDATINFEDIPYEDLPVTYSYTYQIEDACSVKEATTSVTIEPQESAGSDANTAICNTDETFDLNTLVSNATKVGRFEYAGSVIDPVLQLEDYDCGEYVFHHIVNSPEPCLSDTAFYEVTLNCQPYAGEDGATSICAGESVTLFTQLGGDFDADGTWIETTQSGGTLNGSVFDATGVSNGTYIFRYEIEGDAPCVNSSAEVSVEVNGLPKIEGVDLVCSEDGESYSAVITVTGAEPGEYTANYGGTWDGNGVFTSDPIPNQTQETIKISDVNGCGEEEVTVNKRCNCITEASRMQTDTLVVACPGESVEGINLGGFVDDGDDTELYYLVENSGTVLTGVLDSNETGVFDFIPGAMERDRTYYVAIAAGNDMGNGAPDRADACFTVSSGTPVMFASAPTGDLSLAASDICPGENTLAIVDITTGQAPFDVVISNNRNGNTVNISNATTPLQDTVSAMDTTLFTISEITDGYGCVGSGGSATLNVNEAPTADLQNGTACGYTDGDIVIVVDGAGNEWEVVLSSSVEGENGNLDTVITNISRSGFIGRPPFQPNDTVVTYTLVSVSDNSGSVCEGVVSGSFKVNPMPTGTITNSDATYCEGNPIMLTLNATGIGPWLFTIEAGGNTYTANTSQPTETVSISSGLPEGTYQFTVTEIEDLGTGCTKEGEGNPADVVINPGPDAQMGFDLQGEPDPNPTKTLTICDGEDAVIDFQYLSGSGSEFDILWDQNDSIRSPLQLTPGIITSETIEAHTLKIGTNKFVLIRLSDDTPAQCAGLMVDSVEIIVKPLPEIALNFSDDNICNGESFTVTVTPTATDPIAFDLVDQDGNTTSYTETSGSNSFTVTPPSPGTYTYRVTNLREVGPSVNCTGSYAPTHTVNVIANPTANINTNPIVVCEDTPVELPFTTTGTPDLEVEFSITGDGYVGNPTAATSGGNDSYTLNLDPGVYTASITEVRDGSAAQCSAAGVGSTSIEVVAKPQITSIGFSENPICADDATLFQFEIAGNGPFSVDFTDGISGTFTETVNSDTRYDHQHQGVQNTRFSINQIGDNTVTTTDGSNCLADDLPQTADLVVHPRPELQLIQGDDICQGEVATVQLSVTEAQGPFTLTLFDNITGEEYIKSYTSGGAIAFNAGDYQEKDSLALFPLRVTDNITGCSGDTSDSRVSGNAIVNIRPIPQEQFVVDAMAACAPFTPTATFNPPQNYNSRVTDWTWTLPNGQTVSNEEELHLSFDEPGTEHILRLNYASIHGCEAPEQAQLLTVYNDPVADFVYNPGEPSTINYQVQFIDRSIRAAQYQWTINGDSSYTEERAIYDFPFDEEGFYDACLEVVSPNGCVDERCKEIYVRGESLAYVPNTFTPDGDGLNDVFIPVLSTVDEDSYSLQIFNRWGEIIFETQDVNEGWDGITNMGTEAPTGAYVYKLKAVSDFEEVQLIESTGVIRLLR